MQPPQENFGIASRGDGTLSEAALYLVVCGRTAATGSAPGLSRDEDSELRRGTPSHSVAPGVLLVGGLSSFRMSGGLPVAERVYKPAGLGAVEHDRQGLAAVLEGAEPE